ncbi:hypothetical protein [Catellatospora sichuanensis]|uniref:hypothetical protein n=1 Tax=Catellatospora sichuanensis TaxID=1969805 RepID=UPI001181EC35|nr:hypothetical protein [Catellatospora sichuanensis]
MTTSTRVVDGPVWPVAGRQEGGDGAGVNLRLPRHRAGRTGRLPFQQLVNQPHRLGLVVADLRTHVGIQPAQAAEAIHDQPVPVLESLFVAFGILEAGGAAQQRNLSAR